MRTNFKIRNYRSETKGFNITYKETDLYIDTVNFDENVKRKAYLSVLRYRNIIEKHSSKSPLFMTSLKPIFYNESDEIENIVKSMYDAACCAEVGPSAAVAGAIAEYVARDLSEFSDDVIVENGGDTFILGRSDKIVQIFSHNYKNFGIKIEKEKLPISVCSSSFTIGHSLSFGRADLVVVISKSGATADAFATSICNSIKKFTDINKTVKVYEKNKYIDGCLIFFKNKIAGWGNLNLIEIEG